MVSLHFNTLQRQNKSPPLCQLVDGGWTTINSSRSIHFIRLQKLMCSGMRGRNRHLSRLLDFKRKKDKNEGIITIKMFLKYFLS
jgi:hypothetical protein